MNRWKRYIIIVFGALLIAGGILAQPVSKKSYRQKDPVAQARDIKDKDPENAIRILNKALQESLDTKDYLTGAQVYTLLGEIYQNIGQNELALQRYNQAYQLWTTLNLPNDLGNILSQIGNVKALLGRYQEAEVNFQQCLEIKGLSQVIQIKCKEGLADTKRQQGAFEQSEALYDTLDNVLTQRQDSLGMARISAKRSQNFLFNEDIQNAQNYYTNSIQQLPADVPSYEDYEPIEQANRALLDAMDDESGKLDITQSTISEQSKRKVPPLARLNEQMQLAELNLSTGRIEEADEVLIKATEEYRSAAISPVKKANIYKLSSSVKLQKGDYAGAIEAYQQYINENDDALAQQEAVIAQQAAILREQGALDLAIKDYLLEQSKQDLMRNQLRAQWVFIVLLLLLLLALGTAYFLVRKKEQKRRKVNNELEIKSLRAQMNPHFIFNALNSINNFIAQQDERSANKYLADFASLMRMVLEHNQKDFISFEEEMRLLELYLKLEHARFGDQFDYSVQKDPELSLSEIEIPPMLIQPFVENAIWHGLRYKSAKGMLKLALLKEGDNLVVRITDDGIGRERSKAAKTNHQSRYKSTGLNNVYQRIALINELYKKSYTLEINDYQEAQEDVGTQVTITIPYEQQD